MKIGTKLQVEEVELGVLLIVKCNADTVGFHMAIAYHQISAAKFIFLQPEIHSEV